MSLRLNGGFHDGVGVEEMGEIDYVFNLLKRCFKSKFEVDLAT